jgi:hypothetical protein
LAATLNATAPLPVPVAPDVTVIHVALLTAVHAHVACVVTFTVPVPPAASTAWLVGAIVYVHAGGGGGAAGCVTVNVWPPIVSVPVRAAPVFAAALNVTDPLPVPAAPAVIVIHVALLVAVHAHAACVVTATFPVPPPAATV